MGSPPLSRRERARAQYHLPLAAHEKIEPHSRKHPVYMYPYIHIIRSGAGRWYTRPSIDKHRARNCSLCSVTRQVFVAGWPRIRKIKMCPSDMYILEIFIFDIDIRYLVLVCDTVRVALFF